LHAAADRTAAGPPGLPPDVVPRGRDGARRTAGRLVVPPRRAEDDAARLGRRRRLAARRLPERLGATHAHAARRAGRRRLVPGALQRRGRADRLHAAAAALRAALGARALDRGPRRGVAELPRPRGRATRDALAARPAPNVIATYRLQ